MEVTELSRVISDVIRPLAEIKAEIPLFVERTIGILFSIALNFARERCCKLAFVFPNHASFVMLRRTSAPFFTNSLVYEGRISS
jgi:hypothetical protein